MLIKWAVKDMISGKYACNNHYWSFKLHENLDEAHLWNTESPAKAFITSNGGYDVTRGGEPYELVPVPIEVSRKLGA